MRHPTIANSQLAVITQTLRRADPLAEPQVEAISQYRIRLLDGDEPDEWSADHGWYAAGDEVTFAEQVYIADVGHESEEAKSPVNVSFWSPKDDNPAQVLGWPEGVSLLQSAPWLPEGVTVEVIKRGDQWYICATIMRVEKTTQSGSRQYSITQLADSEGPTRVAAVFR